MAIANKKETGQKDSKGQEIKVGDLVVLTIPGNRFLGEAIVFKVVEDNGGFFIEKHSGPMSDGDPCYGQKLLGQVYRVVGSLKTGIENDLFKKLRQ